jgi:hypothetical protein
MRMNSSSEIDTKSGDLEGKSCAIVGGSGILREMTLGSEIDAHDVVVRFGAPPLLKEVSGLKTNILMLNPSALELFDHDLHSVVSRMNPLLISLNCCVRSCYQIATKLHRHLTAWNRVLTASDCRYNVRVQDLLEEKYSWQSRGSAPRSASTKNPRHRRPHSVSRRPTTRSHQRASSTSRFLDRSSIHKEAPPRVPSHRHPRRR